MIVNEVFDDMFKTEHQTIVIPINMVGAMGKGLALYAKKRWPSIDPIYQRCCREKVFVNSLITIPVSDGKQVLLLPTKNHWREDSNEWLIERSLEFLVRDYKKLNITSLAIPKLGCGNGNLDFDSVRKLMYKYLDKLDIPIIIYI